MWKLDYFEKKSFAFMINYIDKFNKEIKLVELPSIFG